MSSKCRANYPSEYRAVDNVVGRRFSYLIAALASAGFILSWPVSAEAADTSFPRGPGFYFHLGKLLSFLVVYLCWITTTWWVDRDSAHVKLKTDNWNILLFGCGFLSLVVVWALPWYWVSFVLLVAFYLTISLAYVSYRNQRVPKDQRVLTRRHLKYLAQTYLKLRLGKEQGDTDAGPPLEFVGKSSAHQTEDDSARVARAAASKGYRAAKEMVWEALERRATDIHLEPTKEEMTVRFRVDGILHAADPFSRSMGDAVLNIFKVLGDLDITEKRKPQDGSLSATADGRPIDFRIATAGSVVGEKLVMRILDSSRQIIDLSQLGMRDRQREQIDTIVSQPYGMLIACGPTGAGKSTTLYACLNEIDRYQKNVITIEDPVEYRIDNVTQIEINPKAGKTFASELRSILRQDPDVIYIGEIRDQETAEIACRAAQTGHMVFTTLHANDTVTAVRRLIDLGVQSSMVADSVSAILGQRLVRLLCPKCKVAFKPNPEILRKANLPADKIKVFYRPPETPGEGHDEEADDDGAPGACKHCGGTGYYGRTGIFELLVINDRIRDLIRDNPNSNAIRMEAIKNGMRDLQTDGLRQVIEGKTSLQELLRVTK
jgi:type II secretory ATPase GspE/PulE/Tfp pilus assembly ATPase PilB-like protein